MQVDDVDCASDGVVAPNYHDDDIEDVDFDVILNVVCGNDGV